jgi:ribosomal protein S18 acetylase RimI-like enzyme
MGTIKIVNYTPEHQPFFERFNKAWIEKYFWLEESDRLVLSHPEEAIINKGGAILMAVYDNQIAGGVALLKVSNKVYEFAKMAVQENFRRKGIAEALSHAAIEKARTLGAEKITLYSQTQLQPAILLYYKLGFKEVPLEPGVYERANIKMELLIKSEEKNWEKQKERLKTSGTIYTTN